MKYNNEIFGAICLLAAGFFLSFGGLLIRLIEDASTMQVTSYRSVTFSLMALLYIIIKFKSKTRQAFANIGTSGLLLALIIGTSNIFFVYGMSNTTVTNAVFLMSTGPLWAAFASFLFLKKIVELKTIIAITGSMVGIIVMFSQGLQSSNYLGNVIILGVPICFAFQLTIINKRSDIDYMPSTFFSRCLGIISWSLYDYRSLNQYKGPVYNFVYGCISSWIGIYTDNNWLKIHTTTSCSALCFT